MRYIKGNEKGISLIMVLVIMIIILMTILIVKIVIPPKNNSNEMTAKDIFEIKDKRKIYGAKVEGYDCENNDAITNWRIFYVSDKNIFLISENFITEEYCPKTKNSNFVYNNNANSNYEKYELCMYNVIDDYIGSDSITDKRIKELNSSYFKYLEKNNINSNAENIKAVAYMMDIDIWNGFAGNKSEYAIGGPTLEMFFNSYNEKHGTNYTTSVDNSFGYNIKNYPTGEFGEDDLYTPVDQYGRGSTILASPLNYGNAGSFLPALWFTGSLSETAVVDHYGIRPVICLKSDVKLELIEDGIFRIK